MGLCCCMTMPVPILLNTVGTAQQLCSEILDNLPYSPDLAPLDFHLSGPTRDVLRGRCSASNYELKEVVQMWRVI
jgi:hypothetical protein